MVRTVVPRLFSVPRLDCTLIDIHSHALYGVDDGAKTFDDSLEMIAMAAEHGTTELVVTPHANPTYPFDPAIIADRLAEMNEAAMGVLKIYSGCDFHITYDNVMDACRNPHKYTINHKNYLLVEFSDLLIFENTADIFSQLLDAGMIPIITHPERNALLREKLEDIAQWVENGALVQITGQSLTGKFGHRCQDFCKRLIEHELAHFVASDGHDCEKRPPVLDEAKAWLSKHSGSGVAHMLCVLNPKAAVQGTPLPKPIGRSRSHSTSHSQHHTPERKWLGIF